MDQKSRSMQRRRRVERRRRRRTRNAILIIAVLVPVLLLSVFLVSSMSPAKTQQARLLAQANQAPAYNVQKPQEEPETADSEIAGKWYGLCEKNSITSIEDFRRTVDNDPVLAKHFADFRWEKAQVGNIQEAIWRSVSYRKNDTILQTRKKIRLPAGDPFITDGVRHVRAYCCNDYVLQPPPEEARLDPLQEKIDDPVRRQEIVAGPPAQLSSNPPAQLSAGPPPRKIALATISPVIKPQLITIPNVPEPGTLLLVGTGLAGMVLVHSLRRRK